MIAGVLRLGDRAVRSVMTPRTDVDWIDLRDGEDAIRAQLIAAHHTRIPVSEGDADEIVGVSNRATSSPRFSPAGRSTSAATSARRR